MSYDINTSICCAGKVYNKNGSKSECCGNVKYDPSTSVCCDSKVAPTLTENTTKCCRRKSYVPSSSICCQNKISPLPVNASGYQCCANMPYDPKSSVCCHGRPAPLFPGDTTLCCGVKSYDSTVSVCCAEKISEKSENATDYYGTFFNNSATSMCCSGVPLLKMSDLPFQCYEKESYNP